jgi:hypothetical protein
LYKKTTGKARKFFVFFCLLGGYLFLFYYLSTVRAFVMFRFPLCV